MTREEYLDFCRTLPLTEIDQPFDEDFDTYVARHSDNRKWYALVLTVNGRLAVNMKCDPMEADFLRSAFEGVIPAYHMNKVHWNTVFLDSDVPDDEIFRMTENSYSLTAKKKRR